MSAFLLWFFTSRASCTLPPGVKVEGPPVFALVYLGLGVFSLVWIARDAERRGKSRELAVLFALVACWPLSLLF